MITDINILQTIYDIDCTRRKPKYLQIVDSVARSVKLGKLKKGDRLLSINELSNEFLLARDTVQKAYEILEEKGILLPVKGKGFYINRTDISINLRILLVFNKMSNYKKQIYNSFVSSIGKAAIVDLKIYNCNTGIFEDIINTHLNEYDYYVIMPHFYENTEDAYKTINKIPRERLIILDKDLEYMTGNYAAVYQDFVRDIATALEEGIDLLKKYKRLILVYPSNPRYPREIRIGFENFCMAFNINYKVIEEIDNGTEIFDKDAYVVIEETDLVTLIKNCRQKNLQPGKQIGIISYNDTPLKEILLDGITVISTDHVKMGESAARLILENKKEKIKNPFSLIIRNSL
jgi:DNA-binding transcriptional regulator YhcF (GntR family)